MTDCEIFFLSARITVKQGMIKKFSGIASEVDKANEQTEKGRLFYKFDSALDYSRKFFRTKVYRKSEVFSLPADSPPAQNYVKKYGELATYFSIENYGNISEAVINKTKRLEILLKQFAKNCVDSFGQKGSVESMTTILSTMLITRSSWS